MNSKNKVMKKISNVVGKRRFLFLLFLIFTTQISLNAYSQERKITFSLKNASLKEIISEIRKNSDYDFVYRDVNLESFARQDVTFKDATVGQILTDCLKGTNLGYEINGKTPLIRQKVFCLFHFLEVHIFSFVLGEYAAVYLVFGAAVFYHVATRSGVAA